jgi:hypothetical protein
MWKSLGVWSVLQPDELITCHYAALCNGRIYLQMNLLKKKFQGLLRMFRTIVFAGLTLQLLSATGYAQKFAPYKMWYAPFPGIGGDLAIYDIDIGPDGTVWTIDPYQCKVIHWDKDGNRLGEFGSKGSGLGQFQNPTAIALDPSGNVYVSDQQIGRIQVFQPNGTFVRSFGEQVLGGNSGIMPVAVALDGTVFVADPGNQQVVRFSRTGVFEICWQNGFNYFGGIATDAFGHVYVSDFYNARIQKFRFDGTHVKNLAEGEMSAGLHVDFAGHLVVVDTTSHSIKRMTLDGDLLSIHSPSLTEGRFSGPWAVSTDEAGRLFVADPYADSNGPSIKVYTPIYPKYRQKTTFNISGGFLRGTLIDPEGNLLVCVANDYNPGSIKKFRTDGTYLGDFATGIVDPQCIQNGQNGDIAIVEYRKGLIKLFDRSGLLRWSDFPGPNSYPELLQNVSVVRPDGVIVVCSNDMSFTEYLPDGTKIRQVKVNLPINGPWGLAVDGRGRYWISDFYTSQLELLSPTYEHLKTVNLSQTAQRTLMSRTGVLIVPGTSILSVVSINGELLGEVTNSNSGTTFPESIGTEGLSGLVGVAEDSVGNLYVSDSTNGRIHVLAPWYYDDLLAPTSTFSASPFTTLSNSDVTATITSTDNPGGSGVKEIRYSINMGTVHVISGSSRTFTLSASGTHSIAYWAVDNAGVTETTKYATVRIDKTRPTVDAYAIGSLVIVIAQDTFSGVASTKVSIDGAAAIDYTGSFRTLPGAHTVTYWATDQAGNESTREVMLVGVTVASVAVSPTTLFSTKAGVGTVKLSLAAPGGGVVVMLESNFPAVSVPVSVTVPAGALSVTFPVTAGTVSTDTKAVVTASVGGQEVHGTVYVLVPFPKTLTVSPSTIIGGDAGVGTVALASNAGVGGQVVNLSSSNSNVVVPATVTVPAGATSATFPIQTSIVGSDIAVVISAEADGAGISSTLLVRRVAPKSITFAPSSVVGGNSSVATLTVTKPAPVGGIVIDLRSVSSNVSVPATVTIAAGATTATFPVITVPVKKSESAMIQAYAAGVKVSAVITVTATSVVSISMNPTTVVGGLNSTATVTLNGVAPVGGTTIQLYSTNVAASVPTSVVVPAGSKTVTFPVTTVAVAANTSASIATKYLGTIKSAALTIAAPTVSTLTLAPSSLTGGATSKLTIKLSGKAAIGGVVVALTSSNTVIAQLPTSVTIPAGSDTVDVTIQTGAVAVTTNVTITAKTGAVAKTAVLTVNK